MGDVGEPNGLPVDEWGIRVNENSQPVGSCVTRGGATNSPAAVYAVEKAIDWLKNYSPPEAAGMTFSEAGPIPAQGASPSRCSGTPPSPRQHGRGACR
jgi:glycerol transport system substrate-binding protein